MQNHFHYANLDDLDAAAVKIPYKNSNCSMIIILPNSKTGLPALESKLKGINFRDLSDKMSVEHVILRIPKFKIEFDIDLEVPLKKVNTFKVLKKHILNTLETEKVETLLRYF